jgi:hypothetical protein
MKLFPLNHITLVVVFGGVFLFAMVFNFVGYCLEESGRRKVATQEIHQILEARGTEGFLSAQKNDPWGTPYKTAAVGGGITTYEVQCAGCDKKFDTDDDLKETNSDLNWTKAGTSVGQHTGRAARGFFKGLWNSGDGK